MTTTMMDAYDVLLAGFGRVSRFYSDCDNLVVVTDSKHKREAEKRMTCHGWSLYDAGANDSSIMLTFKRKA